MAEFMLLLPFDTDSEDFTRGFEVGRVWTIVALAIASDALPTDSLTVHASNSEMMLRVADALSVRVTSTDLDETWLDVVFDTLEGESQ